MGISIVKEACSAPLRQMALNAGESADLIIQEILQSDKTQAWDFRTSELVDCYKIGIIDPIKVTRTALQNAASCAGTLITTNFGIIQTE